MGYVVKQVLYRRRSYLVGTECVLYLLAPFFAIANRSYGFLRLYASPCQYVKWTPCNEVSVSGCRSRSVFRVADCSTEYYRYSYVSVTYYVFFGEAVTVFAKSWIPPCPSHGYMAGTVSTPTRCGTLSISWDSSLLHRHSAMVTYFC